jgi:hypothetical protein
MTKRVVQASNKDFKHTRVRLDQEWDQGMGWLDTRTDEDLTWTKPGDFKESGSV